MFCHDPEVMGSNPGSVTKNIHTVAVGVTGQAIGEISNVIKFAPIRFCAMKQS